MKTYACATCPFFITLNSRGFNVTFLKGHAATLRLALICSLFYSLGTMIPRIFSSLYRDRISAPARQITAAETAAIL